MLCGRGNNGGDGMMAARLLAEAGLTAGVVLLGNPAGLEGDAAMAWRELSEGSQCATRAVDTDEDLRAALAVVDPDLVIDAIVGTGFVPPLRGLAATALAWIDKMAQRSQPDRRTRSAR